MTSGPDFIIAGAMKAATSAVYEYLGRHPHVLRRYPKELHFFSLHFEKGIDWYTSKFSDIRNDAEEEKMLIGEASPTYLVYPDVPMRISDVFPETKVIVVLRNPTDRAISHYYHQVNRVKNEPRSIEEVFSADELINVDEKPLTSTFNYIYNGLYGQHLSNWFKKFPREKILVLNYHDLEANPYGLLKELFSFLSLEYHHLESVEKFYGNQYPVAPLEVRKRLDSYFKKDKKVLDDISDKFFNW